MPYQSSEIAKVEYLITLEDGTKKLVLRKEDGTFIDGPGTTDISALNDTYVPKAGPATITVGGVTQFTVNADGVGVGPVAPLGADDLFHVQKDQNTSSGILVKNMHDGVSADAFVHVFSDVTGFSVRSQSAALGAGVNFVCDAGNSALSFLQLANAPIDFYTNGSKRMNLSAAGALTLSVSQPTDTVLTVINPSAAANARALAKVDADSASFRLISASIATGQGCFLQTSGCSTFLIQQLAAAPIQIYVNGAQAMKLDSDQSTTIYGNVGFYGKVPVAQPATPVTLADAIAVIRGCGLAA